VKRKLLGVAVAAFTALAMTAGPAMAEDEVTEEPTVEVAEVVEDVVEPESEVAPEPEPVVEVVADEPEPVVVEPEPVEEAAPVTESEPVATAPAPQASTQGRTAFEPYTESVRWVLPDTWPSEQTPPGNVPAIWPQTRLVGDLECGRWSQDDTYLIDSKADEATFDGLGDTLTNGEDSSIYQSHTFTYGGDCEPAVPNSLSSSHTQQCGSVTISLTNTSPWIYPMSVEISRDGGATWGEHSYGPTVDNRTDGGLSGPQQTATRSRTLDFDEDEDVTHIRYRVQAGSENSLYVGLPVGEWTTVEVDTNCEEPPVCEANLFEGYEDRGGLWEVTYGSQHTDTNGVAVFTNDSYGGLVAFNEGEIPAYMGEPGSEYRWLYVYGDTPGKVYTWDFADGKRVVATVTYSEVGCPQIEWVYTTTPLPPTEATFPTFEITDVCGTADDKAEVITDGEGILGYAVDGGWFAEVLDGYVVTEAPDGWVAVEGGYFYAFTFTDVACPVEPPIEEPPVVEPPVVTPPAVVVPPVTPVPAPQAPVADAPVVTAASSDRLPHTGASLGFLVVAGGLVLAGAAMFVARRVTA
jgi:LPXTG-motif cell wall-anchored protein